jgi:2-amino-4-hydroxy-6-hydroxymethyldihydropteridine diphosphokinase
LKTITRVFLGLGSNLGHREDQIREGLRTLESDGSIRIVRVSSLYESEPVGWDGGPWYLNAVAEVSTTLIAPELLRVTREAERSAGRMERERNAPRPLDIDILLFGTERIILETLEVPHPRMLGRAFVLWPLAEIAPEVEVAPGLGAEEAARKLTEHEAIRRVGSLGTIGEEDALLPV